MNHWDFLELEEQIGRYWHRLVGNAHSYPVYTDAAVTFDSVRTPLGVFFRGLGGAPGIALTTGIRQSPGHRLKLKQRLGIEKELFPLTEGDSERILLPATIAYFPSRDLNRRLYFWLAAYFATAEQPVAAPVHDPLQADLAFLHHSYRTCIQVGERFPVLASDYQRLCDALAAQRPQRPLPAQERAVEAAIMALLGKPCKDPLGNTFLRAIQQSTSDFSHWHAAKHYQPFLPVPLWGKVHSSGRSPAPERDHPDQDGGGSPDMHDNQRKKSRREKFEQSERDDPLLLNRFEKLFSWSEMLNINRAVQDDDADAAQNAAKDMEEITLSTHQHPAATKLKFDLDLAPGDVNPFLLIDELTYPEWDYRRADYHASQCRVIFQQAEEKDAPWTPDLQARRRFRKIRRQFEAIRPKREILRNQLDGIELDMDALVRTQSDLLANGNCSNQVYLKSLRQARDLAVAILVDVSLSTDSWIGGRRILDVEKEALVTLATGLAACRDTFAIYTFTSRKRHFVRVAAVKEFNEAYNDKILRRIASLKPGYYTRMGAALRHTRKLLSVRPERSRLILLLSDGKPNDLDYYEGRYGIEDTRHAIVEARKSGLSVFGITVDRKAQDYFPYLFGKGGYAIVSRPDRLSQVLPVIYQQLVSS
ncbi:nitric oxide reductase NorD protein [Nitrosomonas sp. Nm51]|uniref:nitric oxide reductase activation protein NorD n=1 Tax=Nitrosomonas sp. Nm51 TaxID=133720 RepID=UPI0008D62065|nr:VWA domain-containing protein [Nitrosomonas sp. Nm51]SER79622.1 nitric oxide reductase NorD protein [Nitrosomonas sp. Nm51]